MKLATKNEWKLYDPHFEYEEYFQDYDWPWAGHKFFIYDFIINTEPKIIVELGTQRGTSLFSMAQAVKDGHLSTQLNAIDTWKGDKHTGPYTETYLQDVTRMQQIFYSSLNIRLIRNTFDEAVKMFKDHTISLLHIDGLHTYKAVKHDYETWLQKVKFDGVIVFHDISEKKDDFGVYKLWEKLKRKYKHIEFVHSHGLGIIFLNNKLPSYFEKVEVMRRYYSCKNSANIATHENLKLAFQLNNLNTQASLSISELEVIKSSKMYKLWRRINMIKDKFRSKS